MVECKIRSVDPWGSRFKDTGVTSDGVDDDVTVTLVTGVVPVPKGVEAGVSGVDDDVTVTLVTGVVPVLKGVQAGVSGVDVCSSALLLAR